MALAAARPPPSVKRRAAAVLSLAAGAVAIGVAVLFPLRTLGLGLVALALAWIALACAWFGLRRRGLARLAGLGAALVALVSTGVLLAVLRAFVDLVVFSGAAAVALGSRRVACTPELPRSAGVPGPPVVRALPAGERAVLLINPRSGGDKAQRYRLAEEARLRGIEAVVMQAGDDLAALADAAVAGRPQSIGMAGGDGSMAVVAARAAAHDIAFVCVPAGTRNHLALDLGVDRDDPVGALDAFTDGIERRVDLAEVNGRVFVNNVSLGVYARVVQADSYRADKVGTTLELLPDLIGPEAAPFELRYVDPSGRRHDDARLVLVSNNRYLTRRLTALGSRPRLDAGRLGVIVARVDGRIDALRLAGLEAAGSVDRHGGWEDWEAETFEVEAPGAIEAGVDGEAVVLEPPVHFRSRAGALRVRISRGHPGVSPAAVEDALVARQSVGALLAVAAGREIAPRASPPTPTGYPPTPLSASVTPIRSPRR